MKPHLTKGFFTAFLAGLNRKVGCSPGMQPVARHGLWTGSSGSASPVSTDVWAAYLWMVCPAGVCSTSSPACRRTSMTVLFPRK